MELGPLNAIVTDVVQSPDRPLHGMQRSVKNASVEIVEDDLTTPIAIFADPLGVTELSPPFRTDDSGRVVHADSTALYAATQNACVIARKGSNSWTMRVPIMSAEDVGGRQLAYAQAFLSGNQQGSTSSSYADITGIDTGDFETASRPIVVQFSCHYAYCTLASTIVGVQIIDTQNSDAIIARWFGGSAANNQTFAFDHWRTLPSLTPGTHRFKAQIVRAGGSGTAYVTSTDPALVGAGDNLGSPVAIRVVEG